MTTTDTNDRVTVNITGLPKYETITDKLDGQTFRGNNITLTAAQVDSGLELHSYYRRGVTRSTLTLTANAKDPVTGAVTSAAPQTITVTDTRSAATTPTTSPQTPTVTRSPCPRPARSRPRRVDLGSSRAAQNRATRSPAPRRRPRRSRQPRRSAAASSEARVPGEPGLCAVQQHVSAAGPGDRRPQAIVTDTQPRQVRPPRAWQARASRC